MLSKSPQLITANELIQFFPSDTPESSLEHLAEHINQQMASALLAIEIDKHTIEHWGIYEAIQTIKNTELPQVLKTREGGWKRYNGLSFHGQEQLEKIQEIIKKHSNHFPTEKPKRNENQIQRHAIGSMLFDIHIECEKINPAMTWYSHYMDCPFAELAKLIIVGKMELDGISDSAIRSYIKDISKPTRDEQKQFLAHMRKHLGTEKVKINSPEYQKALQDYLDKK